MTTVRWWDLAFAGSLLIMALVAWFEPESGDTGRVGAIVTLAAIGVCYLSFGRRGISGSARADSGSTASHHRLSVAFSVVIILGCGVAAAFNPSMATLQAVGFSLLWTLFESYIVSVVVSAVLAVSVGIGLTINFGGTFDGIIQASVIEGISLIFAIALGTWITRIAHEGEKHRLLLEELRSAQGELAAMYREAGSASERERLARDIHDTIAQSLTSLVMLAQRAHGELAHISDPAQVLAGAVSSATVSAATQISDVTASVDATIDLIESTARDALTEARSLVASMSAVRASGSDSSLAETITRLAERFGRETGIQVDASVSASGADGPDRLGVPVGPGGLDRELEVVLLRCAQEGLANVRKHSRASSATVKIGQTDHAVTLEVQDNGRGLGSYSPENETGFGLAGMRDRVNLVGGHLRVTNGDSGGTVLRVTIPITAPGTTR